MNEVPYDRIEKSEYHFKIWLEEKMYIIEIKGSRLDLENVKKKRKYNKELFEVKGELPDTLINYLEGMGFEIGKKKANENIKHSPFERKVLGLE